MALKLPDEVLRDATIWGFRAGFDDQDFLKSLHSPRWGERFGDAAQPLPTGRPLHELIRAICQEHDIAQPFVWAKLVGETSFLTAPEPPGKGYKAPLGFDCPDDGRDPRPQYYGVLRNLQGGIAWWRRFLDKWDWQRRLRCGLADINVSAEGQRVRRQTVSPRTAAEVAYLIYTPHLYSLHDFHTIWRQRFAGQLEPPVQVVLPGLPASRFTWPVAQMLSRRVNVTLHGRSVHRPGDVRHHNVFKGYTEWGTNGHRGVGDAVDLFCPANTEVFAIGDGFQTRWRNDLTRQEVIYLEGDGWLAVYAHIDAVHEGQQVAVQRGEVVGRVRPDLADPHLHFELWLDGQAVAAQDPASLRDLMAHRLGLAEVAPVRQEPRVIVAKPAGSEPSADGLLYCPLPSRWDSQANQAEVDSAALAEWLGTSIGGLPKYAPLREALTAMGVTARFDLTHLHAANPRIYVFTG
ncbi:MAG: M23 family metallopeptidase [Fimbriimonadaceae bacterium]|nr:M23 family metallopeptidase [Fimbriimonadaceae bacterium]